MVINFRGKYFPVTNKLKSITLITCKYLYHYYKYKHRIKQFITIIHYVLYKHSIGLYDKTLCGN